MKVSETIYSVYILTNVRKTVLYAGVTNDLEQRIVEHYIDRIEQKTFACKYSCHFLLFYENYKYVNDAIAREKEIKGWVRIKKAKEFLRSGKTIADVCASVGFESIPSFTGLFKKITGSTPAAFQNKKKIEKKQF